MIARATSLPKGLEFYRRTDTFTEKTVPQGLLNAHSTKDGVWGVIKVESGSLSYRVTDARREPFETVLTPEAPAGIVEPTIQHHVMPLGSACFHVEFYRAAR